MDEKWFKAQQKKAGVTAEDIARRIGRDRSVVSKIYSGQRSMTFEWAQAFAEALAVPIAEVLEHSGVATAAVAQQFVPGFSESDVAPWRAQSGQDRQAPTIAEALGARAGVDIWKCQTNSMSLQGILSGDWLLVDTHAAERVKAGDVVIAQAYDNSRAGALTILRRFEPPVLVAASPSLSDRRVYVVDGVNVLIRGKVVASWRV